MSNLFSEIAIEFTVIFGGLIVTAFGVLAALWLNGAIGT
jgi:hypothetical protein